MPERNKILVIDDDETIPAIIQSFLEPQGYEVSSALDGASGLDRIKSDPPDVILLDQRMRGLSGIDVLKRLCRDEETGTIPVIMITGDNNLRQLSLSIELGASDYILKPLSRECLLTRLHNVIE